MLKNQDWRWGSSKPGSIASSAILAIACLTGCAGIPDRPELYPDKWAPQRSDEEWNVPRAASQFAFTNAAIGARPLAPAAVQTDQQYDLPRLIDIALLNNPETQHSWSAARAAAASFGAA